MIFKQKLVLLIFCTLILTFANGQEMTTWNRTKISLANSKAVDTTLNVLQNTKSLENIFERLHQLKKNPENKKVVFTHIGDSHIQADKMTAVLRNDLQTYFGNAGRGLLFPFQVAKTNGPSDVVSNSNTNWASSRLSKLNVNVNCGIAAYGIKTALPSAELTIAIKDSLKNSFDHVTLFFSKGLDRISFESELFNDDLLLNMHSQMASITTPNAISKFKIKFGAAPDSAIEFFGLTVSKNNVSGIIYNAIGANGAKLNDYNEAPLFWEQLPELKTDCYIISLGTNEAQNQNLTAELYTNNLKQMIEKIRNISHDAPIIVVSPPVSYFKKVKPNKILAVISGAITNFCQLNNTAFFDLYTISKGARGAAVWRKLKLLNTDLVHFTNAGYTLQADLLLTAFANAYNDYVAKK